MQFVACNVVKEELYSTSATVVHNIAKKSFTVSGS